MDRQELLQILSDNFNAVMRERRPYYEAVASLSFLAQFEDVFGADYVEKQRRYCMRIIAEQVAKHPFLAVSRLALPYNGNYWWREGTQSPWVDADSETFFACFDPALENGEVTVFHRSAGGQLVIKQGFVGEPNL